MIKTCKVCGQEFDCGSAHKTTTCPTCIESGYKYCTSCNKVLPVSAFGRLGKSSNKYKPKCKNCYTAYDNERYSTDMAVRDAKIASSVNYCINRRKLDAEYAERCREHNKVSKRNRWATDEYYRIKTKINGHIRRELSRASDALTVEQWHEACRVFDLSCAYCGASEKLTMDHVVPVSAGGTTSIDNIVPACVHCNSSKHSLDLVEWYTAQPFYNKDRLEKILRFISREVI